MRKIQKLVLYLMFGGESPEHEISFITAKQALRHLDVDAYTIYPIYVDKQNHFFHIPNFSEFITFADFPKLHLEPITLSLQAGELSVSKGRLGKLPTPHVCLLAFHGGIGENGTMQGFLDMLHVPYTGPSVKGAVYGMDKIVMKEILEANGIQNIPWVHASMQEWEQSKGQVMHRIARLGAYPYIVKPSSLGSSIGVAKVNNQEELIDAIETNFLYDAFVVVEHFCENIIELNCSALRYQGNIETSAIEKVEKESSQLYSYADKYLQGGKKKTGSSEGMASARKNVPADIPSHIQKKVEELAKKAYICLSLESLVRIDFIYDPKLEQVYIIEPNTIPGSLSYYLWEGKGIQFSQVLDMMIEESVDRYNRKKQFITSFDSPLWDVS